LVLAAGAGRRFGGPKALARLDGERLVDRAVRTLRDGGLADVLVVSGAGSLPDVDAVEVPNPMWREGMGSSLRAGLDFAEAGGWSAAVVLLVDTPWVGSGAVARLLAAAGPETVAAQATYGGTGGHPVLLARSVWADVAASATGDRGARAWLAAHPGRVLAVPADGTGDPRDVDHPGDLPDT
jgi:CTP:molybdopterin cytidylyltransferase MocA